ncbi:TPA: hypothetical protein U2J78_004964 [Serratia marcescens]|nr:hypothetical protein [Serratia marcescens]
MNKKQKHSHKYQHYLPAVYLKYFTRLDVKGDACYVFDKLYPNSEQKRNGFRPLNRHYICGENYRHTIRLMKDEKNMIENYFKIFEDEHDHFVSRITKIYDNYKRYIDWLRDNVLLKRSNLKREFNRIVKCFPIHYNMAYRVDSKEVNQYIKLMCKVYLYRLKKMDASYNLKERRKLSILADALFSVGYTFSQNFEPTILKGIIDNNNSNINDIVNINDNFNIIDPDEINELRIALNSMSVMGLRKNLKSIREAFEKIHRYIIYPLANMSLKNKTIYILKTSDYIVSGDMPFCNLKINSGDAKIVNSDVFTLTPNYMIVFLDENQGAYFNFRTDISKYISIKNYKNAERYVFSNNLNSLLETCNSTNN